ncbi:MAG: hypothetical protein ACR2PL_15660 [Dehalococcoidia bacterium]
MVQPRQRCLQLAVLVIVVLVVAALPRVHAQAAVLRPEFRPASTLTAPSRAADPMPSGTDRAELPNPAETPQITCGQWLGPQFLNRFRSPDNNGGCNGTPTISPITLGVTAGVPNPLPVSGNVTLEENVTIPANASFTAQSGANIQISGGIGFYIQRNGTLQAQGATFAAADPTAPFAGLDVAGTATLDNVTIRGAGNGSLGTINFGCCYRDGIFVEGPGGTLTLTNSTISTISSLGSNPQGIAIEGRGAASLTLTNVNFTGIADPFDVQAGDSAVQVNLSAITLDQPIQLPIGQAHIQSGLTFNFATPFINYFGGTEPGDETFTQFTASGAVVPYHILSNLTVPAGRMLTVPPGDLLQFASGSGLYLAGNSGSTPGGKLLAPGSATQLINFDEIPGGQPWQGWTWGQGQTLRWTSSSWLTPATAVSVRSTSAVAIAWGSSSRGRVAR